MHKLLTPILMLMMIGCGDDNGGPKEEELTAREFISRGWEQFGNADYSAARADFLKAIERDPNQSDAWNGAGWSAGRVGGVLDEAAGYFSECLSIDTTRYDALGGWAFAAYQMGDYAPAIGKADSLLNRRPRWVFLHEQTLDYRDLLLMKAAAHFNLGNFRASLDIVVTRFNVEFDADVDTPAGRAELLEEIERLESIYG